MLELKDVCFQVNEDAKDKEILKNINLKLDDRFVAITGPNGGGKSTLARVIAAERSIWTAWISPIIPLQSAQKQGSASRFSSRYALRG